MSQDDNKMNQASTLNVPCATHQANTPAHISAFHPSTFSGELEQVHLLENASASVTLCSQNPKEKPENLTKNLECK